jgi:hypothetical protein
MQADEKSMSYFDAELGLLDRRVFSLADIYRRELDTIFLNRWLFVGPTEWVSQTGDFYASYMGETPVLLWRDLAGVLRLIVNRCPWGDDRLTDFDHGNAEGFVCRCHGRPYLYRRDPLTDGLEEVPRLEVFGAFVFGCFNRDVPGVAEQLGEFAWYFPLISERPAGGLEFYGGNALRSTIRANWKLAAETYCGDLYRDIVAHRATREVLGADPPLTERRGFQVSAGAGAMVVATDEDAIGEAGRLRGASVQDARDGMTPLTATAFPNLSFDGRAQALHVWHPRSPSVTEVHTYCLAGSDEPAVSKERRRKLCQLRFGPCGLQSADEDTVWTAITRGAEASRHHGRPLNLQMGLGRERRTNLPGRIADLVSEMNQRSFFGWWQDELRRTPQRVRIAKVKFK